MSKVIRINEKTVHGQFRSTRNLTVKEITPSLMKRLAWNCPYMYRLTDQQAEELCMSLVDKKLAQHGWTDWRLS